MARVLWVAWIWVVAVALGPTPGFAVRLMPWVVRFGLLLARVAAA